MDFPQPVEVAEGLWWVGSGITTAGLQCNSYLLIQGGNAVVFDPGSVIDADIVMDKVASLVPLEQLDAIVCSHQDPDLCSAIPLFEKHGFKGVICCHERAAMLIAYYGISSPFHTVCTSAFRYKLADGTSIRFLVAPYLHFPGAIMSYLPRQKALISGDLFGSITNQWTLFAGPDYAEEMKTFHENYMPSHDILKPAMSQLLRYDIDVICPQHGSIINTDVRTYIEILRDLPCGFFMDPLRKNLIKSGGIISLCDQILKRYLAVHGTKEVREVFDKSPFTIDYQQKRMAKTAVAESDVWDSFFQLVYERKGMEWITMVAPAVELLCKEYSISLPEIFETITFNSQQNMDMMNVRFQELENRKLELEARLKHVEESLYRDPITNLYNQEFHDLFMAEEMISYRVKKQPFAFLLLGIDNLSNINLDFGREEGDATMRTLAYVLRQHTGVLEQLFRLAGGIFAIHYLDVLQEDAILKADTLLNTITESELFIVPLTVSMGLYHSDELPERVLEDSEQMRQVVVQSARFRLKVAKKQGGGTLVHDTSVTGGARTAFVILLIDTPGIQRDIVQRALERERYHVIVASDGAEGRRMTEDEHPDIIVSELLVPKLGAFTLRKELLSSVETRRIPFLLMSVNKNEETVGRALELGIIHFFQRPVMVPELVGVVGNIASKLQLQEE